VHDEEFKGVGCTCGGLTGPFLRPEVEGEGRCGRRAGCCETELHQPERTVQS